MTTRHLLNACIVLMYLVSLSTCAEKNRTPTFTANPNPQKISKYDRMDLAISQEFQRTKDPQTQTVPRSRLMKVYQRLARQPQGLDSRAAISGVSWTERGPDNVAGRCRSMLVDLNDGTGLTVFVASVGGGLWKTTDISASSPVWTPVNDLFDNLAITSIAQDPSNNNTMYFGTGEGWFNYDAIDGMGIWKSTDGGANWSQLSSTNNSFFTHVQKVVVDASGNLFACTRAAGILRSTDGGSNWAQVLGFGVTATTNRAADLEIASDGDMYAAMGIFTEDGIYRSTDGGLTWSKLSTGLPSSGYYRIELACAPSNANRVYAIYQNASDNNALGIYKSTNGGNSWSSVTNPAAFGMSNFAGAQAWYNLTMAVDPSDADRLFIGGIDVLVSDDAGSSWTQITQWYGGGGMQEIHADQHGVFFAPSSSSIAHFINDGGIWRTTNANEATLSNIVISGKNSGLNVTQFYGNAVHPVEETNYFLAGAQDNGSHQFSNAGVNSTIEVSGGDGALCHIDEDEPDIQITSYVYNYYHLSSNAFASSSVVNFTSGGNPIGSFINPTDYDSRSNTLYAGSIAGGYLRWADVTNNTNASHLAVTDFNSGNITHVMVSPNTENRVFFGLDNGRVIRIDDADGNSPVSSFINSGKGMPTGSISCIAIEDGDDDHLLVTYSNYGVTSVWETKDGGSTWTSKEGNLPDMPIRWAVFHPCDSNQAILATEVGIWSTNDLSAGSVDWGTTNTGFANVRTDMLQFRSTDGLLVAATHGRGLYTTDVFSKPTIAFTATTSTDQEGSSGGTEGTCKKYKEATFTLSITGAPTSDVDVTVSAGGNSTATEEEDYQIMTPTITFPSGASSSQTVTVRMYEDGEVEGDETLTLTLSLDNSCDAYIGTNDTLTLTIQDIDSSTGAPESVAGSSDTHVLGPNKTIYFHASDGDLIAKIENLSSHDFGCTTVSVDRAGVAAEDFWYADDNSKDLASKAILVTPTTNNATASTIVTFYYSTLEVSGWELATGNSWSSDAQIVKNGGSIGNVTPNDPYPDGTDISKAVDSKGLFNGGPDYYITASFGDGFSGFGAGAPGTGPAFPIDLLDLQANEDEIGVRVDWLTAGPYDGVFEVERSADGQEFETIAIVMGDNSEFADTEYAVWDDEPLTGVALYRIKQLDLDGTITHSHSVEVTIGANEGINGIRLSPNPFVDHIRLYGSQGISNGFEMVWMDVKGSVLAKEFVPETRERLNRVFSLPQGVKQNGIYFLLLKSATGETKVFKLLKRGN